MSWWRGCYDPWQRKQTQKKNTVNAGTQTGGGLVTAVAPELNKGQSFVDPLTGKEVTQTQAIYNALRGLGSGRPGVFPNGTVIEVHQPPSANNYFDWFFDYCDKEIVTAFLLSSRSVLEAKHGSKADSGNSQDLLDELKMFVRSRICQQLTILGRRLLRMSFGDEVASKFAPKFSMQKASRPDFASNATAIGGLYQGLTAAGKILSPNQDAYFLQEVLGAPAPDADVDAHTDANEIDTDDDEDDIPGGDSAGSAGFPAGDVRTTGPAKRPGAAAPKPTAKKNSAGFSAHSDGRRLPEVDEGRAAQAREIKRVLDEWRNQPRRMG